MGSQRIFRLSGLALWVGGATFILHIVSRSGITAAPDPAAVYRESLWVPINVLGVLGAMAMLLGLPGLYAKTAATMGMPGLVGFVLFAGAWSFFGLFLSLYAVLVAPWLADRAPALVAANASPPEGLVVAFIVGLLAWLVGTVLIAIPFVRGPLAPRWVGWALVASAPAAVVGDLVIAPNGPATNFPLNLLSNLGILLLAVAIGGAGYRMWAGSAGNAMEGESSPRI